MSAPRPLSRDAVDRDERVASLRDQVSQLGQENVLAWARLDPCQAVFEGAVTDAALTDYSPDGCMQRAALARRTRDRATTLVRELAEVASPAGAEPALADATAAAMIR